MSRPNAWPLVWCWLLTFNALWPLFVVAGGGPAWFLAVSFSSAITQVMLLDRLRLADSLLLTPQTQPEPDPPLAETKVRTEIIRTSDGGYQSILYGSLGLNEEQTRELGEAIIKHDVFVRDILPECIPNHTGRYPKLRDELKRLGLICADQKMTDQGLDYFSRFSPTLQAIRIPTNGRGPTTTDDDQGLIRAYQEHRP